MIAQRPLPVRMPAIKVASEGPVPPAPPMVIAAPAVNGRSTTAPLGLSVGAAEPTISPIRAVTVPFRLPVAVVILLAYINPHFYDDAFTNGTLASILAGAAGLLVLGILLLRYFVNSIR